MNGINTGDGNASTNNPNPAGPNDNHGTAVAGIAGARGNNFLGVAGGAFGAKIMAIKPWNENADGFFGFSVANLTEAINYLSGLTANGLGTWRGADVSNHSYGIGSNSAITTAFNSSTLNGRNGLGVPAFVATGNGASGFQRIDVAINIPFNLFNEGAQVRLRYKKDGSLSAGDDAVWIADVRQPGGIRNQFDTFGNFEGWTSNGDALGAMTGEPSRQFGTGRNRPIEVVVWNCWVTETNETLC